MFIHLLNTLSKGMIFGRLPPELVDMTLKYVIAFESIYDACNCSLVCRDWVASCRPVVWSGIWIDRKERVDQFLDIIETSPVIAKLVRSIILQGSVRIPDSNDEGKRTNIGWLPYAFSKLHNRLINLYEVSIKHAKILKPQDGKDWATALYPLMDTMETVRSLEVCDVKASISIFQELFVAFPNLEEVKIKDCEYDTLANADWRTTGDRKPTFQHLEVWHYLEMPYVLLNGSTRRLSCFKRFLLSAEPTHCLRSLDLWIWQEDMEDILRLLRNLGPRLEDLSLMSRPEKPLRYKSVDLILEAQ